MGENAQEHDTKGGESTESEPPKTGAESRRPDRTFQAGDEETLVQGDDAAGRDRSLGQSRHDAPNGFPLVRGFEIQEEAIADYRILPDDERLNPSENLDYPVEGSGIRQSVVKGYRYESRQGEGRAQAVGGEQASLHAGYFGRDVAGGKQGTEVGRHPRTIVRTRRGNVKPYGVNA